MVLTLPSAPARREQQRKGQPYRGNCLRVLICVESRCQHNRYSRAGGERDPGPVRKESPLSPREGGTCSPQHHPLPLLQQFGDSVLAGAWR